ncbi:tetratricopeptide repeat protein [Thermogemmatispora carboxidivorans]|uniref:tetratricopeptide repeat protein n=1 Tax=Thermogemmatispora carboxidivorans TaxID=1382306 RepID=UPI00138DEF76|nr:tetratricopeptide repeat protein [Thermogemmatispora carboxidivorans]
MSEETRQIQGDTGVRENYRKAIAALNLRRPQLALELMSKVLRAQPENTRALALMAVAAMRNKDYAQAEAAIRDALRLDPLSSTYHLLYGMILLAKSQLLLAQAELEKARELNPLNPWPYYLLGASYLSLKPRPEVDKARPYVYKAVELDPEEARLQALLAYQASVDGNLDLAQQAYLRALALEPQNAAILSDYGNFLLNYQTRPQQALHLLKEAIRLDPEEKATQQRLLQAIRAAHPLYRPILSYRTFLLRLPPSLRGGFGCVTALCILVIGRLLLFLVENISNLALTERNPQLLNIAIALMCLGLLIVTPFGLFAAYRAVMAPLLLFLIKRGWIK